MPQKLKADETVKSNLDIVFDLLGGVGVESFIVTFDGGGDDGQVEEASDFKPKKSEKKALALVGESVQGARVSNGIRWHPNGTKETMWKEDPTLNEMIEAICYDTLENVQGGWEINEGSYGTFHFDVKKRKMSLDFNERIIESNLSQYYM